MPTNLLNLPCFKVIGIIENEHDYHVQVESTEAPNACPHCRSGGLVGFGRREQMVRDLPMHGRRVGLYIDTRRYRCRNCSKTFYESLPEVDEKRLMTKRLCQWIGKQSIRRTFSGIAEEVGCTEFTVRSVFNDYINELEKTVRFETPKWMGIDEIHIINKPRCVVSNIENNTLVGMLHNRNKDTVVKYLFSMPNREKVQYVAMDMWAPYRDAVQVVLPDATIVIDKFHVVRMANDAMEKARKGYRESLSAKQKRGLMHDRFVLLKRERTLTDAERFTLDGWVRNYPILGEAYRAKEAFYAIYEEGVSPEHAESRFNAWQASLAPEVRPHFSDLIRAFQNCQPYILNYFTHPITNAYTESLNNLLRVMNRLGRGYSFEALRAKILFTESAYAKEKVRPKFERRRSGAVSFSPPGDAYGYGMPIDRGIRDISYQLDDGYAEKNYGVDISTLIRMIESGEF